MVNASLNWASIVGIVLAVGGALLYFMRSFKPALARDYDVFFAAVGLLCGGILFFQGWRLDPILQFGQFLLAGTTVFFAYESVRLRGVTTEQARRSSYFDDDEPMPAPGPYRPRMGGRAWGEADVDRFDEPQPLRRRIPSREDEGDEDDFYRARRPSSRAAIPERAASRRPAQDEWAPQSSPAAPDRSRYSASASSSASRPASDFGARRRDRDNGSEPRRGSRPVASSEGIPRSSRRPTDAGTGGAGAASMQAARGPAGVPQGSPISGAAGAPGGGPGRSNRPDSGDISDADFTPIKPPASPAPRPRDNSSRFDD